MATSKTTQTRADIEEGTGAKVRNLSTKVVRRGATTTQDARGAPCRSLGETQHSETKINAILQSNVRGTVEVHQP